MRLLLILFLGLYAIIIFPFTAYMNAKPFVEKIGYVPQADMLRLMAADQKQFLACGLVMRTLIYFGTLVEKKEAKIDIPPDYYAIFKTIDTAVKLDPYNMDAYYFAQAVLVWDVRRIKEVNTLLEYGMKYRDWDFYLPFFAGFNYAYFLKDYGRAAGFYQRAGELTGDELPVSLAGRYFYEAGSTKLGIAYLDTMIKGARSASVRKNLATRLEALRGVSVIEQALERYRAEKGVPPGDIPVLVASGYLPKVPVDPYGGKFFLDEQGRVRTTSKLAAVAPN
jgi:tetratricopeptide (TPR) repeat protein